MKTPGARFLADLEWEGRPERPSLRRAIRHQLRRFDPTLRVIAEGFLAEASAIDLLAVGSEGEIISIRIGQGEDDAELLTRCLADLNWLRPRLADFLKLAPGLGLEPSAEPRAMLLCPEFSRETRAAVENFPTRSIELATYHCFRQQGQLSVLLETVSPDRAQTAKWQLADSSLATTPSPPHSPSPRLAESSQPLAGMPSASSFRTGLTDADLHTEVEEEKTLD